VFPDISFDEPEPPRAGAEVTSPPTPPDHAATAPSLAARQGAALWRGIEPLSGALPDNTHVVRDPDALCAALQAQMDRPILRTGTALVSMGLLSQAQLDAELAQPEAPAGLPIGERLVRAGCLSREALQVGLLRRMAFPVVDVARYPTETEVLRRLPLQKALQIGALPLALHQQQLVVVMNDPRCMEHLSELKFMLQRRILPVLCWKGDLPTHIRSIHARHGLVGNESRQFG
jgi:hypothetical protein